LSNELDIDEVSVAILVDNVIADLLATGEKSQDPVKAGVPGVVAT
jgi:hypothetical protein